MIKRLVYLILASPSFAAAESFICSADGAALVEDGENKSVIAGEVDARPLKYLVTQVEGKWVVKDFKSKRVLFDKCSEELFCERSDSFAGAFLKTRTNAFSVSFILMKKGGSQWGVAKGRCISAKE